MKMETYYEYIEDNGGGFVVEEHGPLCDTAYCVILNDNAETITLPNGYNGDTVECLLNPVLDEDTSCVKLRVKNSPYLFRWVAKSDIEKWRNK